jgi:Flp pilus assembly protein TadG
MVEFALVTVLLVMVLLSVVEMGRMVLVYTTLANSARIGARYAMVHGSDRATGSAVYNASGPGNPCTCQQVQDVVKSFASAGALDTSRLTITVAYPTTATTSLNTPGSPVTVTVSYPYNPLLGYFRTVLNQTLSSTSEAIITY